MTNVFSGSLNSGAAPVGAKSWWKLAGGSRHRLISRVPSALVSEQTFSLYHKLGFARFGRIVVFAITLQFQPTLIAAEDDTSKQSAAQKVAEARFLKLRTEAVTKWNKKFFVEEKLTPEQIQLFVTTRLDAEDRMMSRLRKTPGAILLPSLMAAEMDAAFAKAFDPEIAKRYREWANTEDVWTFLIDDPILKARDWLTADELVNLAKAWAPTMAGSMNEGYKPTFAKATKSEPLALYDRTMMSYVVAAKGCLNPAKFSKLKERFAEMRLAAISYMENPEE